MAITALQAPDMMGLSFDGRVRDRARQRMAARYSVHELHERVVGHGETNLEAARRALRTLGFIRDEN